MNNNKKKFLPNNSVNRYICLTESTAQHVEPQFQEKTTKNQTEAVWHFVLRSDVELNSSTSVMIFLWLQKQGRKGRSAALDSRGFADTLAHTLLRPS